MKTKTSEALAVTAAIEARVPVLLWGAPGIGKTAQVEQIAQDLDAGYVPLAVSTRPPEDFAGLPVPSANGGVSQEPLSWLTRAISLGESRPGGCIVLLDELSTAPPATQAALLSLVQSRYCGDTVIPRSVAWVAAANPPSQAADGWELSAPTISRWVHVQWPAPTLEEWTSWLVEQSVTPSDKGTPWAGAQGAQARAHVAGFLARRPGALSGPPSGESDVAYPCPRAWEAAARLLTLAPDELTRDILLTSAVGTGTAREMSAWLRDADLPAPEDMLANPSDWEPYPGRTDRTLAALLGAVAAVTEHATAERYAAAVHLVVAAYEGGVAGATLVAGRQLVNADALRPLPTPPEMVRILPLLAEAGVV